MSHQVDHITLFVFQMFLMFLGVGEMSGTCQRPLRQVFGVRLKNIYKVGPY